jgi:hypothetical protein
MFNPIYRLILLIAAINADTVWATGPNSYDKPVMHPAIPLLDEDGNHVLDSGKPYSTKMSCGNGSGGGCHDYEKMNHAYHFEQGRDEAEDQYGTRRGVNHLVSPGYFGGYNCVQGNQPSYLASKVNSDGVNFAEWGAAGFLKACSSCHAGGGWAEYDRNGIRYDLRDVSSIPFGDGDYYERDNNSLTGLSLFDWKKSGVREADCMTCHADFTLLEKKGTELNLPGSSPPYNHWGFLQDQKFVRNNFFRYANSAMFEFLNIRPEDPAYPVGLNLLTVKRKNFKTGTRYRPDYDLDLDTNGNPQLIWNAAAFDASGKVQIPMLRFPGNDNCMMCHFASSGINRISSTNQNGSRRGFHGFGEDALTETDTNGIVIPDFKDDVHKGKSWTDDNGQTRIIDNCNACHAKQYYKPAFRNVDLDADHNFPKGDGDNDIRRDLDFYPGPLSCEYCHDKAKAPALPSGQKNALDAHRELWTVKGDFAGYTANTLNKITQTHLDVVACQTCHIPSAAQSEASPLKIRYRYRRGEDGKMKIIPYKPHTRYFAQDKVSGRVLSRYETQPSAPLATYEDWITLKTSYDKLLESKGYENPNVRFVQTESNEYIITHQTRTSPEALQCESCHARKQNGSFSSLLSATGLLGQGNVAEVRQLPDKRLVDEGIVELGQPYFKVDNSGLITENTADVLTATLHDPAMSVFRASSARDFAGEWKSLDIGSAFERLNIIDNAQQELLKTELSANKIWIYDVLHGLKNLKAMGLMAGSRSQLDNLFGMQRILVEVRPPSNEEKTGLARAKLGIPASDIYSLSIRDTQTLSTVNSFPTSKTLLKLPYRGAETTLEKIKVLALNEGLWSQATVEPLLLQSMTTDPGSTLPGSNLLPPINEGFLVMTINGPFQGLMLADPGKFNPTENAPGTGPKTMTEATKLWKKALQALNNAKKTLSKAETSASKALNAAQKAKVQAQLLAEKAAGLSGATQIRAQKAANKAASTATKAENKANALENAKNAAADKVSIKSQAYAVAAAQYSEFINLANQ